MEELGGAARLLNISQRRDKRFFILSLFKELAKEAEAGEPRAALSQHVEHVHQRSFGKRVISGLGGTETVRRCNCGGHQPRRIGPPQHHCRDSACH